MKLIIRYTAVYILILLSGLISISCVDESQDDCPDTDPDRWLLITVRDVITGEDITTSEELENVSLYLFNNAGELQRIYRVPVEDVRNRVPVDISDTGLDDGFVTIWSNLSDYVFISENSSRASIGELSLHVNENRIERGYFMCPGDLFFGYDSFSFLSSTKTGTPETQYIDIARKNARIHITVRGMEYRENPDDYFFKISTLYDGYNFTGGPLGRNLDIRESGIFNTEKEFVSPAAFMMIHAENGRIYSDDSCVKIHIMEDSRENGIDKEIVSAIKDIEGNYIQFEPGKTVNVLIVIDEKGDIEVITRITDWDTIYQWTNW